MSNVYVVFATSKTTKKSIPNLSETNKIELAIVNYLKINSALYNVIPK